jgi:hypothetical protein
VKSHQLEISEHYGVSHYLFSRQAEGRIITGAHYTASSKAIPAQLHIGSYVLDSNFVAAVFVDCPVGLFQRKTIGAGP